MIDLVYKTLQTVINKENNGYISPDEFNLLANTVQEEIFRGYFDNINKDQVKQNKGYTSKGFGNLVSNQEARMDKFITSYTTTGSSGNIGSTPLNNNYYPLPDDYYLLVENGVQLIAIQTINTVGGTTEIISEVHNTVVEKINHSSLGYLSKSIAAPTTLYPVFTLQKSYGEASSSPQNRNSSEVLILHPPNNPSTQYRKLRITYIRKPVTPKWTYNTIPVAGAMFNSSALDYRDFELHPSEFTNIVLILLTYFGITLRENDIVQISEGLRDKMNQKEN